MHSQVLLQSYKNANFLIILTMGTRQLACKGEVCFGETNFALDFALATAALYSLVVIFDSTMKC